MCVFGQLAFCIFLVFFFRSFIINGCWVSENMSLGVDLIGFFSTSAAVEPVRGIHALSDSNLWLIFTEELRKIRMHGRFINSHPL